MTWDDFYDRYCDWSEATIKTRISSLEDIGAGEDVVDVILELSDEKTKAQLVRKAMKLGVLFTHDDFMNLDEELPKAIFDEVARYAGFSAENPFFDENDFDWDDFYASYFDLPEDMVRRCIPRIKKFGDSEEVADVITFLSYPADDALYERAIACGVKFTEEQMEDIGRQEPSFAEDIRASNNISNGQRKNSKKGRSSVAKAIGIGAILGLFSGLFGDKKTSRTL